MFTDDAKTVRKMMMIGAFCWAVHNLLVWSPMAAVMETFFFCSNLIGYLRFERETAKEIKEHDTATPVDQHPEQVPL